MSEVAKVISRNQRIWQNIEQGKSFPFQKPQYPIQALLDCVGKYGWLPEYLARHPQDITRIKQHLPDHHLDHYLQQQWHDPQNNLLTVVIPHPTQQQATQSHPTHTAGMHHTTPPLPSYYFDSQPAALQRLHQLSQLHIDHALVLASIPKDHVIIDLEIDPKTKKLNVGGIISGGHAYYVDAADQEVIRQHLVNARIILGHNIRAFDWKYLSEDTLLGPELAKALASKILDTLELHSLLRPHVPSQALTKVYREHISKSDPLLDCIETWKVYQEAIAVLPTLQPIFREMLRYGLAPGPLKQLCLDTPTATVNETVADANPAVSAISAEVLRYIWSLPPEDPQNLGALVYVHWKLYNQQVVARRPAWISHQFESFHAAERALQPLDTSPEKLEAFLKRWYGDEYRFRNGQLEIIQSLLSGHEIPLGILPTGGGKSLTFQFPAMLLSHYYRGLSIIICPLIALIEDQVMNIKHNLPDWANRVAMLSGTQSPREQQQVLEDIWNGHIDIVYLSPERLRNTGVQRLLQHRPPHLWVIDEAHTFSQWGMDFRPDFLRVPSILCTIHRSGTPEASQPLVGCVTATATPKVIDDLRQRLGQQLQPLLNRPIQQVPLYSSPFQWRSEITSSIRKVPYPERFQEITQLLREQTSEGVSIIYLQSRKGTEEWASRLESLRDSPLRVAAFHSKVPAERKRQILQEFKSGELDVVVATSAFGMGIDRKGIHTVIHVKPPSSPESYLQEIGRVARVPGERGRAIMFWDDADFHMLFKQEKDNRIGGNKSLKDCWGIIRKRLDEPVAQRWVSSFEFQNILPQERPEDLATQARVILFALEDYDLLNEGEQQAAKLHIVLKKPPTDSNLGADGQMVNCHIRQMKPKENEPIDVDLRELALMCKCKPNHLLRGLRQMMKAGYAQWHYRLSIRLRRGAKGRFTSAQNSLKAFIAHLAEQDQPDFSHMLLRNVQIDLTRRAKGADVHMALKSLVFFKLARYTLHHEIANVHFNSENAVNYQQNTSALARDLKELSELWFNITKVIFDLLDEHAKSDANKHPFQIDLVQLEVLLPDNENFTALDALLGLQMLGILDCSRSDHEEGQLVYIYRGSKKRYDAVAYRPLETHYNQRAQRIHGMRQILLQDTETERIQLFKDYFELDLSTFCKKHLPDHEMSTSLQIPEVQKRILSGLNDIQQQVVTDDQSRALLLIAGPGSGKTRTIVHRVANLVALRDVPAHRVLVLAYNSTAVAEVRERIHQLLGNLNIKVDVFTFHGLARKLTGLSERDAPNSAAQDKHDWILQQALDHLQEHPSPYQYILVDEYQDIKPLEYQLVTRLTDFQAAALGDDEDENQQGYLVAVGDDDQNLYSFAGADIGFIRQFKQDYQISDENVLYLTKNYRSTSKIVAVANRFIQYALPSDQRLKGEGQQIVCARSEPPEESSDVCFGRYTKRIDAAYTIAERIQALLAAGEQAHEIAILASKWEHLYEVQHELHQRNIASQCINNPDDYRPIQSYLGQALSAALLSTPDEISPDASQTLEELRQTLQLSPQDESWPLLQESVANLQNVSYETIELRLQTAKNTRLGGVVFSSYHSAKGCEFDVVFVLSEYGSNHAHNLNEEQDRTRAFYVALTRARRFLYVLRHAEQCHPLLTERPLQEGWQEDGVQRFIVLTHPKPPSELVFEILPAISWFNLSPKALIMPDGRAAIEHFAQHWDRSHPVYTQRTKAGNWSIRQQQVKQTPLLSLLSSHGSTEVDKWQKKQGTFTAIPHTVLQYWRNDEFYGEDYTGTETHHYILICRFKVTLKV